MAAQQETVIRWIREERTVLGIELGSTRIKAVLIGEDHSPIAAGNHCWENRLADGVWTYTLEDIWGGLQEAYRNLACDVKERWGEDLRKVKAMGISAMMHGYMVFDREGKLLTPFRTWRNTMTGEASRRLTELFNYPVPQRWSIAHLYQAILNGEDHVGRIDYMTTLEGYVHWKLTGQRVLGIGDAAGMFPADSRTHDFDRAMAEAFDRLIEERRYPWKLRDILPRVLTAGEDGGVLTREGAGLLDPGGTLQPGIRMCPPEGDAGTGMAATNSVRPRTGNVSAGTSVFAMVVLEHPLKKVHPEIDLVTTPAGDPVAMVHCNNCTSDLNGWAGLFGEFAGALGAEADSDKVFGLLYKKAMEGDPDCGGLLAYNYVSGEHITGFEEGRPLFVRCPGNRFTLANFMRAHLCTAFGALKLGLDILFKEEDVKLDLLLGHGGLFKTRGAGQELMAAAAKVPVAVMETAGEGGAWGCGLLAAYMVWKKENETLDEYLERAVFAGKTGCTTRIPSKESIAGFERFMERYRAGLSVERAAVDSLR